MRVQLPERRSSLIGLTVPLLLLANAGCATHVADRAAPLSPVGQRIDAYVDSLVHAGKFAGTVLVADHGRILFKRSYGDASVELHVPLANSDRYRLHSITKQFTAMAVLILSNEHRVDVSASIRQYLPELPESWGAATVGQLLTHTSGIPNEENDWAETFVSNDEHTQLENLKAAAPLFASKPLAEKPGTVWRYNNFTYDLLACVVERASGKPFEQFVEERIFQPAGMTGAGFDRRLQTGHGMYVASAAVDRLTPGYNGDASHLLVAAPHMFASAGAGGMFATAEDLLRYDEALYAGSVIPADIARRAVDSAFQVKPTVAYGYGWLITRTTDGHVVLHHSGGNNGYVSEYARYPAEHVAIIILSNRGWADPEAMRSEIARMMFGPRYP
jgi:D-alanyl-D-alanine carboxypeptidase